MNDIRALIEELVDIGVDPIDAADIVARAAIAGAARAPRPASTGAERQARYRARQKLREEAQKRDESDVTVTASDACDVTRDGGEVLSPEKRSPTPPKKTNPKPIPPSPPKGGSSPREFDRFWALYPNKVGKRAAEGCFVRARRRVTFDDLMAGLQAYVSKRDDRPWCNPTTWLNQDRWEDTPAQQPRGSPGPSHQRQAQPKGADWFDLAADYLDEQNGNSGSYSRDRDDVQGFPVLTIEHHQGER